jgi:hypothetical protein
MSKYNQQQLINRDKIIKSQKLFGNYLDSEIINRLINLFDENNKTNNSIVKYVEDERKEEGLSNLNITIKSKVYGTNKNNSTLILKIFKEDKH